MATRKDFMKISTLTGVEGYILVDSQAKIAVQDIKDPQTMARITFSCGQNCFAIGRTQFKYLFFSRKNQKDFFIFPLGKYYLGVVKQGHADNSILVDTILKFIEDLT